MMIVRQRGTVVWGVCVVLALVGCEESEEGADTGGSDTAVRDTRVTPDTGGPDGRDGGRETDGGRADVAVDTVDASHSSDVGGDTGEAADTGGDTPDVDASELGGNAAFLAQADSRAMWVWSGTPTVKELLNNENAARDKLFQFAQAPHGEASRAIDRIFFEARETTGDRKEELVSVTYDPLTESPGTRRLRAFLREAHDRGMEVEYLDGQAIWLATDQNAEVPKKICETVVAFNEGAGSRAEMFDGLHLDIEPHTVTSGPYAGDWWENRYPNGYNREWTARWKEILKACRSTLDDFEQRTGHHLTLSSDLGADYSHYNEPLTDFLNDPNGPLDYVTIMNYYDNRPNDEGDPSYFYGMSDGNAIVGGVRENLSGYDRVPVMFGFETGPPAIAENKASFYQEGYEVMYGVVETLFDDYGDRNLTGAAFHHYAPDAYRAMER